ncbi:MAG TPA: Nif3-like dinuclear metal center hexameric protein [Methanocorpusculum sp.]|nr:Nif3-like dinuclear metal center hexameric protein [Methanocorpusculum sp.]
MKRSEFIAEMEKIAPPELAEDFDKVGRIGLICEGTDEIEKIACALDATPTVTEAAANLGADALVVHHPAFWNPMYSVVGRNAEILRPLLQNNINLYVMHTNFDHAAGGINDALAEVLGLSDCVRLNATPSSVGVVGNLRGSLSDVAKILGCGLRAWGDVSQVKRIAVAGGSAFDYDLIDEAKEAGAEAFMASELRYNLALEAPLPCIEATHCALEVLGMRALAVRMGWEYIDDIPQTTIIL